MPTEKDDFHYRQFSESPKLPSRGFFVALGCVLLSLPFVYAYGLHMGKYGHLYALIRARHAIDNYQGDHRTTASSALRKVVLPTNEYYFLYMDSSNGKISYSKGGWMATVIETSQGERFEKTETFDYCRSRAIGDEDARFKENLPSLESMEKEAEYNKQQGIRENPWHKSYREVLPWREAKSLSELKVNLLADGFVQVAK